MKAVEAHQEQVLIWRQPRALERKWELLEGDELAGRMVWRNMRAYVELTEGQWVFRRYGLFKRHIAVLEGETGTEVARFNYTGPLKGELCLPDGRVYAWKRPTLFRNRWEWHDGNHMMVVDCEIHSTIGKNGADIKVYIPIEDRHVFQMMVGLSMAWVYYYLMDSQTVII